MCATTLEKKNKEQRLVNQLLCNEIQPKNSPLRDNKNQSPLKPIIFFKGCEFSLVVLASSWSQQFYQLQNKILLKDLGGRTYNARKLLFFPPCTAFRRNFFKIEDVSRVEQKSLSQETFCNSFKIRLQRHKRKGKLLKVSVLKVRGH